jgi:molybdopterin synthase catalytic subunit
MAHISIVIQEQDFNVGECLADMRAISKESGALVNFIGLVREESNNAIKVESLFLEHYPGMSEIIIRQHVDKACSQWPLIGVTVIHRIGELKTGEQIVLVAVSSSHRKAAFSAAEFIMDFLKCEAPFWKKQKSTKGDQWLEASVKDQQALEKWSNQE